MGQHGSTLAELMVEMIQASSDAFADRDQMHWEMTTTSMNKYRDARAGYIDAEEIQRKTGE